MNLDRAFSGKWYICTRVHPQLASMIGKYKKLKQDFENLEKEYSREVAKNLDLQYEYDNLKADYTNESTQRAEIERLHENTRRLKHDMKKQLK